MPVNSHKQISKFLLKRFSHDKLFENVNPKNGDKFFNKIKVAWFLDIKKREIKEVPIKDINIEFGYFGDYIEKVLSAKEGVFAEFLTAMDKWEMSAKFGNNSTFELGKYEEIANEFLRLSLVRSENMLEFIKANSVYAPLIKGTALYDQIFTRDKLVEIMLTKPILVEEMKKYRVNLMLNITSTNFITAKNCWYSAYENNTDQQIIFPIDSKKALIWYKKEFDERYRLPNGAIRVQYINSELGVENLNNYCLRSQMHSDGDFLVAKDKLELEKILLKIDLLT